MIAGGAVLIGIFGVVPEETHTLDELLHLYARPSFIVWITLLSLSIIVLLALAHITEWALESRLRKIQEDRMDSYVSSTPGSPTVARSTAGLLWRKYRGPTRTKSGSGLHSGGTSKYGSVEGSSTNGGEETVGSRAPGSHTRSDEGEQVGGGKPLMVNTQLGTLQAWETTHSEAIERTKLVLGLSYGIASGTLSGLCLLFAKTGIDLLILTVMGNNQFGRFQAWLIVIVLLVCALLQVWYFFCLLSRQEANIYRSLAILSQPGPATSGPDPYLSSRLLLLQPLVHHLRPHLLQPMVAPLWPAIWARHSWY